MTKRYRPSALIVALAVGWSAMFMAAATSSAQAPASGPAPASMPATASMPASATAPFKLATYNVYYQASDARSLASIVDIVAKSDADVVALQETTDNLAAFIRKKLAGQYPQMTFHGAPYAGGLAILTRNPVEKSVLPPSNGGLFSTLIVRTQLGGRNVWIANLHLLPTVPGKSISEYMAQFAKSDDVRRKEMQSILQGLDKLNKAKDPVILMGDLNSPSQFAPTMILVGKGFIDSFAAVTRQPDTQPTWQANWQGVDYGFRLDYIFHSRLLRTLDSKIVPGGPSDHRMVVSRLQRADLVPASAPAASMPVEIPNTPSGLPIGRPTLEIPAATTAKAPTPPPLPSKTVAESLASPEALAAGLRAGLGKMQFLEQKVAWKLVVQEVAQQDDATVIKANSPSGFLITCKVPPTLKALASQFKAEDSIEVEGKILNLEYDKPQEALDIFGAKIDMLGVLLDMTKVQRIAKPAR